VLKQILENHPCPIGKPLHRRLKLITRTRSNLVVLDNMPVLRLFLNQKSSQKKGGNVPKEYIPGVQKGIESVLGSGVVAGYPVLGMKATLVDGAYHDVDSSVMAFEIAGRAATRKGLQKAKARLMEPLMQVDISTPEEYMGDVLGDINARRGLVGELGERGNVKTISAMVPLANMFQYVSSLRSMSKGRANYSMKLANYDFVPPNLETELKAGFTLAEED